MSNLCATHFAVVAITLAAASSANAAGEILITHAKALAGNVTAGDAAGYPVTISIPGTFQLASNLFVPAGKIGISIGAPNVTIDLNGNALQGSNVAWYGIIGGGKGLTVTNGTINNFKFDGVNAPGLYANINHVRVVENQRDGIVCSAHCLVEANIVAENGRYGVSLNRGLVLRNIVNSNGDYGVVASQHSAFGQNLLDDNRDEFVDDEHTGIEILHTNVCGADECTVP
jgi:hypothetical protein